MRRLLPWPAKHPDTRQEAPTPTLGPRFQDALVFATGLHAEQRRKGGEIPYAAHLLAVAALVLEDGGDEDEAIAGLLHDAVEDQGGRPVLDQIRTRFGAEVAAIVDGCTDAYQVPKPPWRERKEAYVAHVKVAPSAVRRVSCADKLHNARSLVLDYRELGEALWSRFNASRDETLWYYRSLVSALRGNGGGRLVEELARTVEELERLVAGGQPAR